MSTGEKQTYRDKNDMPTERAVLEREWLAMRLALAMPRETATALRLSQEVLRSLTFKDAKVESALAAIAKALNSIPSQDAQAEQGGK